jgi:hypothetical protein
MEINRLIDEGSNYYFENKNSNFNDENKYPSTEEIAKFLGNNVNKDPLRDLPQDKSSEIKDKVEGDNKDNPSDIKEKSDRDGIISKVE